MRVLPSSLEVTISATVCCSMSVFRKTGKVAMRWK
jgi:hypothetical protein